MITKITCRYSFEVLDFKCNDFGFTFNIGVSYLWYYYKTSMEKTFLNQRSARTTISNLYIMSLLENHCYTVAWSFMKLYIFIISTSQYGGDIFSSFPLHNMVEMYFYHFHFTIWWRYNIKITKPMY